MASAASEPWSRLKRMRPWAAAAAVVVVVWKKCKSRRRRLECEKTSVKEREGCVLEQMERERRNEGGHKKGLTLLVRMDSLARGSFDKLWWAPKQSSWQLKEGESTLAARWPRENAV